MKEKEALKSLTLTTKGEVPSKKNSYRYGRYGLYKPKNITDFEQMVADEISAQKCRRHMEGVLSVKITIYTARNGDLDNRVTTLLDAIQYGGLIKNDRDVKHITADEFPCTPKLAKAMITVGVV